MEAYDQLRRLAAVLDARIAKRVNRGASISWVVPVAFDSRAAQGRGRLLDREILAQLCNTYPGRVTPPVRDSVTARDAYLESLPVGAYAPDTPVANDYATAARVIIKGATS